MKNFKWYRKACGGTWYCNKKKFLFITYHSWSRFKSYDIHWDCQTIKKEKYGQYNTKTDWV